jgi:PAS domain S-box-containing protein
VLVVVRNLLDSSTPPRNFVIDFIFIGMFLFLRRLLFADRVKLVGYLILISAGILLTVSVSSEGTILAPATALFSLLVIMSGFIFNLRGIIAATIISSLLVAGLILAHQAGILPPPNYTESTFQWFVFTITFGLTGWLAYFYSQLTDQALERSRMEIRERERAEVELRKLTRAVEQSPASIVITDLNGNIEYVNPRFTQVTGYGFDEALGKNPRILKTELTPPETYPQLWKTILNGKEWHGEFTNRKKDGSVYYESAIISPITNPGGITTHYLAVKEDIPHAVINCAFSKS